jgi:hypothetical protein
MGGNRELGRIFREREERRSTFRETEGVTVDNWEFDVFSRILDVFKCGAVDS